MFREAPEIVYTGLSKNIGRPKDLEKNNEDPSYFNSDVNLAIPVEDTKEYQEAHKNALVNLRILVNSRVECSKN